MDKTQHSCPEQVFLCSGEQEKIIIVYIKKNYKYAFSSQKGHFLGQKVNHSLPIFPLKNIMCLRKHHCKKRHHKKRHHKKTPSLKTASLSENC